MGEPCFWGMYMPGMLSGFSLGVSLTITLLAILGILGKPQAEAVFNSVAYKTALARMDRARAALAPKEPS